MRLKVPSTPAWAWASGSLNTHPKCQPVSPPHFSRLGSWSGSEPGHANACSRCSPCEFTYPWSPAPAPRPGLLFAACHSPRRLFSPRAGWVGLPPAAAAKGAPVAAASVSPWGPQAGRAHSRCYLYAGGGVRQSLPKITRLCPFSLH